MTDASRQFVDVPGSFLHYRTHGQGQDVVLCNPGSADLRVWAVPRTRSTATDRRVRRTTPPGYQSSAVPVSVT
jgi:hypothetical protein